MSKLGCLALRHLFQLGDFFDIHFQKQDISMLDASYDVPYLGDGDRGHLLDVYRLKGKTADAPTIINRLPNSLEPSFMAARSPELKPAVRSVTD